MYVGRYCSVRLKQSQEASQSAKWVMYCQIKIEPSEYNHFVFHELALLHSSKGGQLMYERRYFGIGASFHFYGKDNHSVSAPQQLRIQDNSSFVFRYHFTYMISSGRMINGDLVT